MAQHTDHLRGLPLYSDESRDSAFGDDVWQQAWPDPTYDWQTLAPFPANAMGGLLGSRELFIPLPEQVTHSHVAGTAPADGDPSGQLWFGSEGPQDGANTSTGSSDNQIGHIDSDAGGRDVGVVNTDNLPSGSSAGYEAIGLDTAAGLYFAYDAENILHVGHITNDTETGSSSEIAQTHMVFGTGANADEVEALAVDPIHHVVYMGLFGQSDQGTGILEIQYNPATGALTNPYNASTGQITDFNHMLVNDPNTGGPIVNIVGMQYDLSNHKLYYIDDTNGWPGSTGNGTTWGQRNGIYVINTQDGSGNLLSVGAGDAPTPTQLSSSSQFVAGDNTHYISGFVVDDATQQIYFTVNNNLNPNDASQESTTIYRMSINGGPATAMSLPGGVTLHFSSYFDDGSNAMALDANSQQIYFADNYNSKVIRVQLSGDGLSFASGTNSFMVLDSNNIVLDNGNETNGVSNVGDLYFDSLPTLNSGTHTLSGTATEALQGGSALTLLTGAGITVTDPDGAELGFATVKIANAQAGDTLAASTAGTNITASYNSTMHTLTLSGEDTYAHYEQVMNAVTYADGGTDNSTGSHPTRTLDWTISDGITIANPTASDPNIAVTTLVINRAPTLGSDSYNVIEASSASGTSGTAGTGVFGNDSDKDGDSLTVSAVNGSGANVGSGTFQGTYGHLNLAANGSFTYAADNTSAIDSAATGSHPTDSFTYTVSDGHGGSTTQTVTFTIDRAPTLGADSYNVVESASASGTAGLAGTGVLGNDSDKDGDTIHVTAVNGSNANVGSGTFQGTYGHLNLAGNGSFTYSADNTSAIDSAATGSHLTDSFTYTVSDGSTTTTQTVTFTLDRAPTVVTQNETVAEGGTATGTNGTGGTGTLAGDSDRDGDSLLITKLNGNNIGDSISNFAGTYGHLTLTSSGQYSYVADNTSAIDAAPTGSHPIDTFTVAVDDGHGGTTNETLNFSIDRAAIAQTDPITTTESATVTASTRGTGLLGNDSDPDTGNNTGLSVTQVNGSAGNVGNQVNFADGSFITINADGTYTYDPNHAWDFLPSSLSGAPSTGTETFTYQITGGAFVTDTITITGQDSNDTLQGSAGADTYNGGIGDDTFKMQDGGNDNVSGGVGDDRFYFGGSLTAADVINGGTGTDTLVLGGDYTAGNALVLSATSLTSVEEIDLHAGFSYGITTNDANVGAGQTLIVSGAQMGAGDALTFNGSAETDGHFNISLGSGNDNVTGGAQSDTFNLGRGGVDTAHGGGGNDTFLLGGALAAADTIDGGTGSDSVTLNGDYSGGNALTLGASTLTSVEQIRFTPGDNYDITTNDGNVAAGAGMAVNATALSAGDSLTFDGSAETDGSFTFKDGAGNDVLTGGAQRDVFDMAKGGNDHVNGGGGNDVINMDGQFNAGDVIDGGAGSDEVTLFGDYSGGITTNSNTLQNVEKLLVYGGDSYNIILNGLNVASGASLTVDGSNLTNGTDTLTLDGSAIGANSVLHLTGGAGADTLIGGNGADKISGGDGNDSITGGNGRDILTGGAGNDTFVYAAPSESTSTNYDSITDLDFSADHIHLAGYFVNAIDTAVTTGTAGASNFDHHMQISVGAAQLGAHDAVLFTADHGTYAGHTYLVIDLNGAAGYQAGSDLVIDITGATNTGSFTTSTFS